MKKRKKIYIKNIQVRLTEQQLNAIYNDLEDQESLSVWIRDAIDMRLSQH
jgi:hypothetical protein